MSYWDDLNNPKLYRKDPTQPSTYIRLSTEPPKSDFVNTVEETPLELPTINFDEDKQTPAKSKKVNNGKETPLELPKLFG